MRIKTGFCLKFTILLFLGPILGLLAGGVSEDPIENARGLIIEQRYNEAILVLTEVIRADDERLDEAEALISQIRSIKTNYNDLLEELVDVLLNEPENYEKALTLINEMNALDQALPDQIEQARITAQVQYDRTRRNQILEEARALLEQKRYVDAANLYLEGYPLQLEPFQARGFTDLTTNSVEQVKTQFVEIADSFETVNSTNLDIKRTEMDQLLVLTNDLKETSDALLSNTALAELSVLISSLNTYNEILFPILESAANSSATLINIRSRVGLEFPDDPDDEYLKFLNDFFAGPPEEEDEGILGAIVRSYLEIFDRILQELEELRKIELEAIQNDIALDQTIELSSYKIEEYQSLISTVLRENLIQADLDSQEPEIDAETGEALAPKIYLSLVESVFGRFSLNMLDYLYTNQSYNWLVLLSNLKNTFTQFSLPPTENLPDWDDQAQLVLNELLDSSNLLETINSDQNLRTEEFQDSNLDSSTVYVDGLLAYFRNQLSNNSLNLLEFLTQNNQGALSIVFSPVAANLANLDSELNKVRAFLAGEVNPDNPDQLRYYPRESYELSITNREQIVEYIALANQTLERYELSDERIIADSRLLKIRDEALAALENLQALDIAFSQQQNIALARVDEAETLAEEGFQDLIRAADAAENRNFDDSDFFISTASDRFLESLAIQYDEELSNQINARIEQISSRISEIRQQIFTEEVRDLKDFAIAKYNDGDFPEALTDILQAEELFLENIQSSQDDFDPEIVYWKEKIQIANSSQQELELIETDPVFPSLNTYLSLAKQDIENLQVLLSQGNKGTNQFNQIGGRVEENVNNVLLVKPFNFDARVLQLQLLQIQSPEDFERVYASRADETINRSRQNNSGLAELADLNALFAINKNYPGLSRAISELRIKLGLDESPATLQARRNADALYNRALGLRNSSNVDELQAAAGLLTQAIQLNPQDRKYSLLLDEIRLSIGGAPTFSLNITDEQQFRRAENFFNQERYIEAKQITAALLANQNNARYLPLVQLDQLLDTRLGLN